MKNKKILISLVFIMFMVGISYVSAQDIDEIGDLSSNDADEAITVDESLDDNLCSDEGEVLTDSDTSTTVNNWADLGSAVYNNNNYDTVYIGANLTPSGQIVINHDVTIIGSADTYIGGSSSSNPASYSYIPIYSDASGLSITLKNIRFQNCGGNILMQFSGNGNYNIENCTFENCTATGSHQAIVYLNYGYANITDCTFEKCTTSYGTVSNYNAASVDNVHMVVRGTTFKDNTANPEPGAINNCGHLIVYDSVFEGNSASWWAGAIHTHTNANTTIVRSVFRNNIAGWNGGALYSYSYLTVINSTFTGNEAHGSNGGAIAASNYGSRPYVTIENCDFDANSATGSGGAISFGGASLIIDNSRFNNNIASNGNGGAITAGGVSTITNCEFKYNNVITGNKNNGRGGAVYGSGTGHLTVDNCLFVNNTAKDDNSGNALAYSYTGKTANAAFFTYTNNEIYGPNNGTGSVYTANTYLVVVQYNNTISDYSSYVEPENETTGGIVTIPEGTTIGTQVWNASLSGALGGTPLIDGDVIYVPNGHSIYCLNITNGALIWNASCTYIGLDEYNNFHDLVLYNGVLVAPCDMDKLYFFDAATGSEVNATSDMWKASSKYGVLINDDTIYVSSEYPYGENGNAWIAVVKQVNGVYTYMGSILEINGVENYALLSAPVLWNNYIWVNTVNGLMRVDLTTNASSIILTGTVGKPVVGGDYLYILTSDNHIKGVDSTGNVVKDITVSGNVGSTLAINNDNTVLYTVNAEGEIYRAGVSSSSANYINRQINPVSSALTVGSDGYLYAGDDAGILWVIDIYYSLGKWKSTVVWAYNATSTIYGEVINNNIVYVGTEDTFYALYNNNLLSNGINELSYKYNSLLTNKNEKLSSSQGDILNAASEKIIPEGTLTYDVFMDGDTTYYLNGIYYIDSPIMLGINMDDGSEVNNICIKPQEGTNATIVFKKYLNYRDPSCMAIMGGKNITIENVKFTTTSDYRSGSGIFSIFNNPQIHFRNCTFENCTDMESNAEPSIFDIYRDEESLIYPDNVLIDNCKFINCNMKSNIRIEYCNLVNVSNCIFEKNTIKLSEIVSQANIYLENNQFDSNNSISVEGNGKIVSDVYFNVLTEGLIVGESGSIVGELVDDNGNRIYSQNLKFVIDDGEPIAPTSFDKATGLYTLSYTPTTNRDVKVSAVCSNVETLDVTSVDIPVKAKTELTLNITENPVYAGDFVVNATLNSTISGKSIVFNITDSSGEVVKTIVSDITNGFASESLNDLPAGDYTLTAVYAGDDYFAPASLSKAFTIAQADSSIELSLVNEDVYVGDAIGVQAVLPSSATGTVTFRLKDSQQIITVSGEAVSAIFAGLAEGEYTVYATYSGDANYKASEEVNVTFNVVKKDVEFYVSAGWVSLGEDAEIYVYDLPDDATGTITYYINSFDPEVRDVDESLTLSDLPIGKYSVRAVYSGDDKYNGNEATGDLEVYYNLELEEDEFGYGGDALINITFPEELNGMLGVIVDGNTSGAISANVVNGTAVFNLSDLTVGEHTLTLTYQGDKTFETTATITVTPKISSLDDLTTGDNTISLNLPSDATGNMTIRVDDNDPVVVAVVNGTAKYDLNNLSAGEHEISVAYEGNYPSFRTYKDVSVAKATPTASVNAPSSITAGQTVTIPINLPSDATGVVLVDVDGKKYYAEVANGVASVAVAGLTAGNKVLTYKYLGDNKYAASTGSATLKVVAPKAADKITLTLKKVTVKRSAKKLVIKATLKINGKAKKGLKVTFKFKGKKYTAKTNAKGVAKITVKKSVLKKLKKGKKVTYTATYGKTTAKKTVKVKK